MSQSSDGSGAFAIFVLVMIPVVGWAVFGNHSPKEVALKNKKGQVAAATGPTNGTLKISTHFFGDQPDVITFPNGWTLEKYSSSNELEFRRPDGSYFASIFIPGDCGYPLEKNCVKEGDVVEKFIGGPGVAKHVGVFHGNLTLIK